LISMVYNTLYLQDGEQQPIYQSPLSPSLSLPSSKLCFAWLISSRAFLRTSLISSSSSIFTDGVLDSLSSTRFRRTPFRMSPNRLSLPLTGFGSSSSSTGFGLPLEETDAAASLGSPTLSDFFFWHWGRWKGRQRK